MRAELNTAKGIPIIAPITVKHRTTPTISKTSPKITATSLPVNFKIASTGQNNQRINITPQ